MSEEVKITLEDKNTDSSSQLFDNLILNTGHKISDLSKQHRIVLLVIKWFGCPLCQEVLERASEILYLMLQKNSIPVIAHQQKDETCDKFIKTTKNKILKEFLYCRLNKEQRKALGLFDASLISHIKAAPKILNLIANGKNLTLPLDAISPFSCFGVYCIEESKITKQVIYNDIEKRLNFGLFLEDMGFSKTQGTEMDYVSSILKLYDKLDIKILKKITKEVTIKLERNDSYGKALQELLEDDHKRFYFKVFCTNEWASENILFYEEVVQYKKIKDENKDKRVLTARRLYKYYLEEGGIAQVNTSQKLTKPIQETLESLQKDDDVSPEIFDKVIESVFINMCDSYSRFVHSSTFKDMNSKNKTLTYLI